MTLKLPLKVFIGWDSRYPECADVLKYSIQKRCSQPIEVKFLRLKELNLIKPDPLASTEFTYSRFLVPYLCEYKGFALFLDSDMVCQGDMAELFEYCNSDFAIRCVHHNYTTMAKTKMEGQTQTNYRRKNWSSLMLMNCSRLKALTKSFIETATGAALHQFQFLGDPDIGDLPKEWNMLDSWSDKGKIIHYTQGGPWLKEYRNHNYGSIYFKEFYEMVHG